jgi:hypothetical protein
MKEFFSATPNRCLKIIHKCADFIIIRKDFFTTKMFSVEFQATFSNSHRKSAKDNWIKLLEVLERDEFHNSKDLHTRENEMYAAHKSIMN